MYGNTPKQGRPVCCSNNSGPPLNRRRSPRKRLMMNPRTRSRSSSSKSVKVPTIEANTPPRSMSATSTARLPMAFAKGRLTISRSLRFNSTALPAPSIKTTSNLCARRLKLSRASLKKNGFCS